MKATRYGLASATLVILLCASFAGGARFGPAVFEWLNLPWLVQNQLPAGSTEPADVAPTFSLFWEAWNVVTHNYVDKSSLDVQKMTYGAIQGMLNSLGDAGHTRFMSPGALRQEQGSLRGQFIGIGIEVGLRNGQPIVVAPLEDSPAQQSGIQPSDAILRVGGEDVSHLSLAELGSRLRGDAGTSVTITVLHPGSDSPVDITLSRERIRVRPVSWYILPDSNVADIRISSFNGGAASDLKAALKAVTAAHVSGIVFDLRDNPGGILNQAIDVTSQFLDSGTVAIIKDSSGNQRKLEVKPGGLATDIPLTVLVNQGTASAAEVVASALEQNHRATIIGQATFGTSTVLSTFHLKDGSAILLGTQQWLTPDGSLLTGKGLQPDVPVRLSGQSQVLTPAREKQLSPEDIQDSGDAQLLAAVKYLGEHPEIRTAASPA
jgi:carboxyl-terminal processing protease